MLIQVNVTLEHIVKAETSRWSDDNISTTCPIARAINGVCKHFRTTTVGKNRFCTTVRKAGRIYDIPLPQIAIDFIKKFDHCQHVKPISFYVDVPDSKSIIETKKKITADIYH
jgi:hypothetical protein